MGTPLSTSAATRAVSKFVSPISPNLSLRLQTHQFRRDLDMARHVVVPPVELHEVQPLDAEPRQ